MKHTIRCVNPYCVWFGKPLGTIEVAEGHEPITDTRQCWKCKATHRQIIRAPRTVDVPTPLPLLSR